jgi:hypothetical protein
MSVSGATGDASVDRGSDLERATRQLLSQVVLDEGQTGVFSTTPLEPEVNGDYLRDPTHLGIGLHADE